MRGFMFLLMLSKRDSIYKYISPTQPPIQWLLGALFLGIKRPGREDDHLHLVSRSEMRGAITPLPNIPCVVLS